VDLVNQTVHIQQAHLFILQEKALYIIMIRRYFRNCCLCSAEILYPVHHLRRKHDIGAGHILRQNIARCRRSSKYKVYADRYERTVLSIESQTRLSGKHKLALRQNCKNILQGKFELTADELDKLRPYANIIRQTKHFDIVFIRVLQGVLARRLIFPSSRIGDSKSMSSA
jgi:hypothetical protein